MQLSIIIPTLNEAGNIEHLLNDLRNHSPSVELIVVDGGSIDDTKDLATAKADRVLSISASRGRQMNHGAQVATGDVLLFLHADTQLPKNYLSILTLATEQDSVTWGRFNVRLDGKNIAFRVIEWFINMRSKLTRIATGDQALFIKTDTFNQIGGFANIPLLEDVDICSRLRKLAKPCCLNDKVVTSARKWQHNGILKTVCLMWWIRFAYAIGVSPDVLRDQYYR